MHRPRILSALAIGLALAAPACSRSPTGPNDTTWHFLPGRVERLEIPSFRNGRACWIYLPPGYETSGRRYPVLYMNDGESVFDGEGGMRAHRIAEALIRRGEIEPLIIVAVANGPGEQRWYDYTPWGVPPRTGGGDLYLGALRDTVKAEVDRRFRTLRDGPNTAIAGASLGGLISAYAGFAFDSTFGKIAAFSPSYWFLGYRLYDYATQRGRPPGLVRYYQDTGYPEDNDVVGMELVAVEIGLWPGRDFLSVTAPDGEHRNAAWEHRLPIVLRFLFPPRAD